MAYESLLLVPYSKCNSHGRACFWGTDDLGFEEHPQKGCSAMASWDRPRQM